MDDSLTHTHTHAYIQKLGEKGKKRKKKKTEEKKREEKKRKEKKRKEKKRALRFEIQNSKNRKAAEEHINK